MRLIVATDWGTGFQLAPPAEPPPDVLPGGEYTIECKPQQAVAIREVTVHDFQLVQITTALKTARPTVVETRASSPHVRDYQLDGVISVQAAEILSVVLRNDTRAPLKQKDALLVRERAIRLPPPQRVTPPMVQSGLIQAKNGASEVTCERKRN